MKKPKAFVTDHAALRYLERVLGFDVEELKRQMARAVDRAVAAGAGSVVLGGWRYVLKDDAAGRPAVVTVEPATDPQNRRRSRLRTGGIAEVEPATCAVPGCGNAVSDRNPIGLCQVHGGRQMPHVKPMRKDAR